ncbi:P-loop containing nucleoside triphosphate hydrolase protein [Blakeslea trispora]|nr:P-loop containing nucleoside triphosphate hydrolase protein [Blakeslea trispora]
MSFLWSFGTTPKKEPTSPVSLAPAQASFKAMSHTFKKGVQYNMKIAIRGDVMTGKSSLFHRLQGAEFDEAYASTPQIQVANIPWHYKDSSDIVKIEVWDVVDKAHNKTKSAENSAIKLEHSESQQKIENDENESDMGLDAATVNVYRNSHGVIFLFDITKPWTFDYIIKELDHVPETLSVLVLGNFGDKSQERKVDMDVIHTALYEHNQERIRKGAIKPNLIRYAEASMKTGQGLKYIYDYLGVPFLQLMIESLNKQLELKAVEIVDLLEVLDTEDDVPETMQRKRRGQDNFDQPSEPHLTRQKEEMKSAWDQELEAIASDHPSGFERQPTPPPPSAPVETKPKKDVQLVTEQVNVDPFDNAEELADDWFGESTPSTVTRTKQDLYDSDDQIPSNPMVLGDEDVEPIIQYRPTSDTRQSQKEEEEEENESIEEQRDDSEEKPSKDDVYRPPVFKSELDDVWSLGLRRLSGPQIASESEDEDNTMPYVQHEEVSGSTENPWSTDWQESIQEIPYEVTPEVSSSKKKKSTKKSNSKKKKKSASREQ